MEIPNKIADSIIEKLPLICERVSFHGAEWRESMTPVQVYQDVIEPLLKELNYPLPEKLQVLKKVAEYEKKKLENGDFSESDTESEQESSD